MRHSIGDFNKSKLRHSQTEVKNPLPSTEGNHDHMLHCYIMENLLCHKQQ